MSEGEDERPCIKWRRKSTVNTAGEGGETGEKMKGAETGVEEKTETESLRDAETELLIMEYQKKAKPDPTTLLEFFGGEEWREDKGTDLRRCIQHLVDDEFVQQYQRYSMPDEETRETLESCGGIAWREDNEEEGRKCILRLIKEEWTSVKPSVLRYHQALK